MSDRDDHIVAEIERLHVFLTNWLSGGIERDDALFEAEFASRLAPGFENIQPRGAVLSRQVLLDQISAGHGKSPDFRISIPDASARRIAEDLWLAIYTERQTGARNSPGENTRISTALLKTPGDGPPVWLHIHETWVAST